MLFNVIFGSQLFGLLLMLFGCGSNLIIKILQKTFAWINVCAIVIGFWVYYGVSHDASAINGWFIAMNWVNIAIAAIQFYFGYRTSDDSTTHPAKQYH